MKKIFIIFNLLLIFLLSNENANISNLRSNNFIDNTIGQVIEINDSNRSKINYITRKVAHFSLYFLLGISIYLLMCEYVINKFLFVFVSLVLISIFAFFDEYHQIYTGRCFMLSDILIDTIGGITSYIIINVVKKMNFNYNKFRS